MAEMSEMVERVAEAIAKANREPFYLDPDLYREMARAAIEAMREPTEAMGWAGIRSRQALDADHCAGSPSRWAMPEWRAMIAAALPSPAEPG